MVKTRELTTAQAIVRYLQVQLSERDGERTRLIAGMFGIFGHGNVAGMGQALDEYGAGLPFHQAKNEQSMVHAAIGFAKANACRSTLACTASIGPGSTNLLTGAATATINRVPVLLLPSDIYAHRRPGNVLQQLEHRTGGDVSVNDAFRPLSVFFDRISRPEQIIAALPEAMRVLTDPASTGAVTISLPQDVQGEAGRFPDAFFDQRVWRIARPAPDPRDVADAAALIARSRRPAIIAGAGIADAAAGDALRAFSAEFGCPIAETFSGKGVAGSADLLLGGVGLTGTAAAQAILEGADLVLAVGTRLSDFTTASRSLFQAGGIRFLHINVNAADACKLGAMPIVADARLALEQLAEALRAQGWAADARYRDEVRGAISDWTSRYRADIGPRQGALMSQGEIIGQVNKAARAGDVVIAAAGTPPGEIMKGWDNSSGSECLLEFGFSCMGHEIPAGLGVRMARGEPGEIYVVIGDGTYLLCNGELVTAVQEGLKITLVVIDNSGFQCIRDLQEATTGTTNFGNEFRRRAPGGRLDGDYVDVDYAANAASFGCAAFQADTPEALAEALDAARALDRPAVIVCRADRIRKSVGADLWWDLGIAETSEREPVQAARRRFQAGRSRQKTLV